MKVCNESCWRGRPPSSRLTDIEIRVLIQTMYIGLDHQTKTTRTGREDRRVCRWFTVSRLHELTTISRTAISRALRRLAQRGLVVQHRINSKWRVNLPENRIAAD